MPSTPKRRDGQRSAINGEFLALTTLTHPAVSVAAVSFALYCIAILHADAYLEHLGAEMAWFDIHLSRLLVLSHRSIFFSAAITLLYVWLNDHASKSSRGIRLHIVLFSSIVIFLAALYLASKLSYYEPSTWKITGFGLEAMSIILLWLISTIFIRRLAMRRIIIRIRIGKAREQVQQIRASLAIQASQFSDLKAQYALSPTSMHMDKQIACLEEQIDTQRDRLYDSLAKVDDVSRREERVRKQTRFLGHPSGWIQLIILFYMLSKWTATVSAEYDCLIARTTLDKAHLLFTDGRCDIVAMSNTPLCWIELRRPGASDPRVLRTFESWRQTVPPRTDSH